jgi:hypothetical protein
MRLKNGVIWAQMHKSMEHAWEVCERVTWEVCDRDAVITSGRDGVHSQTSLHYEGKALDLRTRDLDTDTVTKYAQALRQCLGDDYDIVIESDHIHVEYDPA